MKNVALDKLVPDVMKTANVLEGVIQYKSVSKTFIFLAAQNGNINANAQMEKYGVLIEDDVGCVITTPIGITKIKSATNVSMITTVLGAHPVTWIPIPVNRHTILQNVFVEMVKQIALRSVALIKIKHVRNVTIKMMCVMMDVPTVAKIFVGMEK